MLKDPARTLRIVRAEKCRRSLADFIRHGWHVLEPTTPVVWNWHIDAIAAHVQAALEDWMGRQRDPSHPQRIRNLLINVPPGTAKSRIVSVFTPAWMWARCPEWRAIFLSANPRVALRDSVYCRDVVESDWYRDWFRPDWSLSEDQNAKGLFRNTAGGFRQAMGFTAKIVGDRADALFVDDPHDPDEVYSQTLRSAITERWDSTVANRVNDLRTSVRIGIMQRVHDEDWSGHVLKHGDWEHLCIPMEFEPERDRTTAIGWMDPRTKPGEPLFPERFPPDILASEKRRLGSFGYAGQHQQRPVPAEGGAFKRSWIRYWEPEMRPLAGDAAVYRLKLRDSEKLVKAKDCRRFGTVDLAFSLRQSADYTVIAAWAATPDSELVLLDLHRERLDGPDIVPAIARMAERHRLAYVGIEDVQAQSLVLKDARRRGLAVRALKADRDKVTRAIPAAVRMEAEQVFFPSAAPWLGDLEAELLSFPNGAHDDAVDCLAYAARELIYKGSPGESGDARDEREAREAEEAKKRQDAWLDPSNPVLWR